jgi:hypothetical protein
MTARPGVVPALVFPFVVLGLLLAACTTGTGPTPSSPVNSASPNAPTATASASAIPTIDGRLQVGPAAAFVDAGPSGVHLENGDDWTLPDWVRPAPNSGFFSEDASLPDRVGVRSIDLAWRQVQPTAAGPLDRRATGKAQGMFFDSLDEQLAEPGDFWMRLFASGEHWAPAWVARKCGVHGYGPDYDGERHLPIWNECVWTELLATYRQLFVDTGLKSDPRLRFVYVPGAFTWAEYDYETINAAVDAGDLDKATYLAWYRHAWSDLATLFGPEANKLVFTGEDYPWGPFGEADDLLAQEAVGAGLGIRTGITELSNFHLSEAPAYGSRILPNGHLEVDESLPVHAGDRIVATENECFNDCGYATREPYYAVRQANLKALQLRMNWMYVVPAASLMDAYPEHWDWVRLSLGQTAGTSADAWADLRDAEDRYWADETGRFTDKAAWFRRPWVRNLERWLVQTDEFGSKAYRTGADQHVNVFEKDNGVANEGLKTNVAAGDTGFVFAIDPRFAAAATGGAVVKVTFLDRGRGSFAVTDGSGTTASVTRTGSGKWRTATLDLPSSLSTLGASPRIRLGLESGADDLVVRFVRLVRVSA